MASNYDHMMAQMPSSMMSKMVPDKPKSKKHGKMKIKSDSSRGDASGY